MKFSHSHYILCLLFLNLSFVSCLNPKDIPSQPVTLALVNGESIKEDDLKMRLNLELKKFGEEFIPDSEEIEDYKRNILKQMIQNKMIIHWGQKNSIVLEPREKAYGIHLMKKGYTDKAFELLLEEASVPVVKWSQIAEEKLFVEKIIKKAVGDHIIITDKDKRQYYEQNLKEFSQKESVRARHLVTDSLEKAKILHERIQKGEDFSKLAIMHSLSPDRAYGGDLGYFSRGSHPIEFEKTCFSLQVGELSEVIKSPYGYHIFRLIHKRGARRQSFEEVEGIIEATLYKQKVEVAYNKWFKEIKNKAQVQIFEEALKNMEI